MRRVLEDKPDIWPKQPEGVVGTLICVPSGLLPPNPDLNATDHGCATRFEYFIKGTVPNQNESLKQAVVIDKTTGDLAAPGKTDNVEPQEHQVLKDQTGATWCLDCPHPQEQPQLIK